jgi:three-Cys-motif partner protein
MFYTIISMGLEDLRINSDGLVCADVHHWAEEKYRLLALYDQLFSSGMKHKWDQRVYIDLYAGGGFSHVQGTSTFLKGSPIIALTVDYPFDKYIFCEEDDELLAALRKRVARIAPAANVSYVPGNCDA